MKPSKNYQDVLSNVEKYYSQKIQKHGPTPAGVDWNSGTSQILRFDQLLKITNSELNCSILDYGCGYGAMARYIRKQHYTGDYLGFDISEYMIRAAQKKLIALPNCRFSSDSGSLRKADYTVASGIFNVKQTIAVRKWRKYVEDTIDIMVKHSRKGFSFNMLTSYSDKEKMRPDLFYADPCYFIDLCIHKYSRHVAMMQDYGLYEFTILVHLR